ncbi:glutaredoxin [Tilletiaria anomala UBC 951]|uniref:Glutaredoxin n=1 Tax=Tilletiaria anomala (strain ATCC 24038 / CBS 436.72 / UBC 951) TaxID=1037660 RepID=A0A066VJI5_TILAU|nr:glutaredoxin [Tilletiaria anomala UBC 951]KDN41862.1 glutaredoxin [Tilletiaria anomala UBC 951]
MTVTTGAPIEITSPEQFTSIMESDLNRVTLLNFWASWAEPCKQMNEIVVEIAAKNPQIAVLNVEAEAQPDVSESFDIDSVPSFVLLRGHTLLSRISGANASALRAAVASYASAPHSSARIVAGGAASSTTAAPRAAPSTYAPSTAVGPSSGPATGSVGQHSLDEDVPVETEEEIEERCKALMKRSKLLVLMKGSPDRPRCGFSQKTVNLLREQAVEFDHYDILEDEGVRQGMKKLNDWPTFPQIIVNGELIGGLDILKASLSHSIGVLHAPLLIQL